MFSFSGFQASCSLYEGHYQNEDHKRQLKEEFGTQSKTVLFIPWKPERMRNLIRFIISGVEPWSFEQRRREAIFIPAGSSFQVRNL